MTWTKYGFGALGACELACILLVFLTLIITYFAINDGNSRIILTTILLLLLSFLFSLSMGIFIFIGTQVRYWNEYYGCDTDYYGLYSSWTSVDTYIQAVDELFCSERCPCYFNRTTQYQFLQNITLAPYLTQWTMSNNSDSPRRFQECDEQTVKEAYNVYLMRNSYYNHTIDPDKFNKYFAHVEDYFHCTGFCSTTYFNRNTQTNGKIAKYIFSDVTKGVPDYIGCLPRLMDWLQKTMNAVGSLFLIIFVLQVIMFIIAIQLLNEADIEEEEEIGSDYIEEDNKLRNRRINDNIDLLDDNSLKDSNFPLKPIKTQNELLNPKKKEDSKKKKKRKKLLQYKKEDESNSKAQSEQSAKYKKEEESNKKEISEQSSKSKKYNDMYKEPSEQSSVEFDNSYRPNLSQQNEKIIQFLPSNCY